MHQVLKGQLNWFKHVENMKLLYFVWQKIDIWVSLVSKQ